MVLTILFIVLPNNGRAFPSHRKMTIRGRAELSYTHIGSRCPTERQKWNGISYAEVSRHGKVLRYLGFHAMFGG